MFVHSAELCILTSSLGPLLSRSHLDLEDDDPTLGDKFSTATLQHDAGAGPIPSTVHGAPTTAAESREVLARLKRMAGFESQDFDPAVLFHSSSPWEHQCLVVAAFNRAILCLERN